MPADQENYVRAAKGLAPTGFVTLRSFDEGVVETLGATVIQNPNRTGYYLKIPGVSGPTGEPGIPVVFSFPEDVFEKWKLPIVMIRREDLTPAMQRWHPGTVQYRAPAPGAKPRSVQVPGEAVPRTGFDSTETYQQSAPFDFTYSIQIQAGSRGALNDVHKILAHVMKTYQPYTYVTVKDTLGDQRTYDAFMEGTSVIDDSFEVGDRVLGFSITLRVEGELDLNDPVVAKTVTALPTIRSNRL